MRQQINLGKKNGIKQRGECLCCEALKEKGHLRNLAFEKRKWSLLRKQGKWI